MKYLIWIIFIICTILIFLGLSIPDSDTLDQAIKAKEIELSNKLIGFGVVGTVSYTHLTLPTKA